MGLTINTPRGGAEEAPVVADRRLYLDRTRARLVEADSSEAASLLAGAGRPIDAAEWRRLGLVFREGRVEQDHAAAEKQRREVEDKMRAPAPNKGGQ